jgi:hypothetical protein
VLADLVDHQNERERNDSTVYAKLVEALRINRCINSKKYKIATLAEKTGFDADVIKRFLLKHRNRPSHGLQAERMKENLYKIHPATSKAKIDPKIILGKVQPHLDELDKLAGYELGSHRIVPMTIEHCVYNIRKIIKESC